MAKKKASSSKLGNKRLNKLAKQGKLRPKRKAYRGVGTSQSGAAAEDMSDRQLDGEKKDDYDAAPSDDDVNFYTSSDAATGFAASFRNNLMGAKRPASDTIEELYEQKLKKRPHLDLGTVKHLLPIKEKNRLIPRSIQVENKEVDGDASSINDGELVLSASDAVSASSLSQRQTAVPLTAVQLYAERQRQLRERKARIASLSCSVMENPELNVGKLRELRLLLDDRDPHLFVTSRKLVMVSLLEIFKDILPGYKIRIATEKEKQQAAAKETKKLRLYEETLLSNYKHYLHFLEQAVKGDVGGSSGSGAVPTAPLKALATDCLCQLMCERPEFNFFANIVAALVQQLASKKDEISDRVCTAVQAVFRRDKSGGAVSLELVRAICRLIKARQFGVRSKVLDVFLSLRINSSGITGDGSGKDKKQQMTHKEKMKSLSRRERKRLKQKELLDKELEEAEAQENQSKITKAQSDIMQAVFGLYFHVLKKATDSHLLSSVLSGLAKFAHCINVDFFGDLFMAFTELLQKDSLSLKDMLNLVHTAFTIISGQGSALNIDPTAFYKRLYGKLLLIPTAARSAAALELHRSCATPWLRLSGANIADRCDNEYATVADAAACLPPLRRDCGDEEMTLLLTCLDLMFAHRRKQVSTQRVLAFVKRICTVALQLTTPHSSAAALACVRTFMQTFPRVDSLYDAEAVGSGMYLPELEEPEHCNAQCTRLYELHVMRHHYATIVADYSRHLCCGAPAQGRGQLTKELAMQTPAVLFQRLQAAVDPVSLLDRLPKRKSSQPTSRKAGLAAKAAASEHHFLHDDFNHIAELYRAETEAR